MIILDKTNSKLRSFLESHPDFTHRRYFSLISLQEIHTLLGVMILFGVFRVNRETISNLYSTDPNLSRPIIKASIPRDRLKVILRFLRFDDASTRLQRVLNDKLAPIREIFDKINESLRNSYFPGKWLTVDDHMAGFRGRCPIKQFIQSKPDKYGIKMFVLADARTYYPCNIEVYIGKTSLHSTKPQEIVMRLCSHIQPGHSLVGDNYFSSVNLANKLRDQYQLHYLGTMRMNRRELPKVIKDTKGVALHSSRFLYSPSNSSTLVSYVAKKSKTVILLSNIHCDKEVPEVSNPKLKPWIILDYNGNKSGVDKMDQMLKEYRCYRAISRWPVVIFFYLIGISALASWVLYQTKHPDLPIVRKKDRRSFLYELGKSIVMPGIDASESSHTFKYLRTDIKSSIRYETRGIKQMNEQISQDEVLLSNQTLSSSSLIQEPVIKKSRCVLCPRSKDKKIRQVCYYCNSHVCNTHCKNFVFCPECQDKITLV